MKWDDLDRAWIVLLALSAGSTVVAASLQIGLDHRVIGVLILSFALLKARLVLAHYLGLSQAPRCEHGFNVFLTLFCLLLLALYLISGFIA